MTCVFWLNRDVDDLVLLFADFWFVLGPSGYTTIWLFINVFTCTCVSVFWNGTTNDDIDLTKVFMIYNATSSIHKDNY